MMKKNRVFSFSSDFTEKFRKVYKPGVKYQYAIILIACQLRRMKVAFAGVISTPPFIPLNKIIDFLEGINGNSSRERWKYKG